MASSARLGTFDDLLSERAEPPEVAAIARALRQVILEGLADAVEVVRLGDGAAAYGLGPKKMSESHVYVMPTRGDVNLGFWHGASLPDPGGLLEGTGKRMRHVKVRPVEEARSEALRQRVADALAERREALGRPA
ncbi:MAG: DUF1801 domain-containing protein [Bacteroidota bacterium]